MSTALIYYYFGDRTGLITNAMEFVNHRAENYAHLEHGGSGLDRLTQQLLAEFQDDAEVRENSAVWGEVRGAAVFDEALRPIIKAATDSWIADLAGMVADGQDDGSIAPSVKARDLAVRMTALVEGLSNRWLSGLLSTRQARAQVKAALAGELAQYAPARTA